jgi:hypothetical protein
VAPSAKKIVGHIQQCEKYAALYKSDPELCLPPEEDFVRRRAEAQDPELRSARREARLNLIFAEVDRRRQQETDRFRSKADMLLAGDDEEEVVVQDV